MSLQVKILVIVLAVVSLYAVFDYASQRFFILPSFVEMEHGEAQNTMRRCVGAFRKEISEIDDFTRMEHNVSTGLETDFLVISIS